MIVGVRIEVSMPNDGANRSHYGRRLGGNELIVVAENDANLGTAQSTKAKPEKKCGINNSHQLILMCRQ